MLIEEVGESAGPNEGSSFWEGKKNSRLSVLHAYLLEKRGHQKRRAKELESLEKTQEHRRSET